MSDSVRPHRQQPTRLPCPWDSQGKNTGVGCHFLLQCVRVKVKVKSLSRVRLSATPWTVAHQAPPSMGFSRQEYWSGVPLPSPNISVSGVFILPSLEAQRVRRIPYSWPHCYQKNQNYNSFLRLCNLLWTKPNTSVQSLKKNKGFEHKALSRESDSCANT